jgi:hypothetical protein
LKEESYTSQKKVKFVRTEGDNQQAKAAFYDNTDVLAQKLGDQTGLETPVVQALTDEY